MRECSIGMELCPCTAGLVSRGMSCGNIEYDASMKTTFWTIMDLLNCNAILFTNWWFKTKISFFLVIFSCVHNFFCESRIKIKPSYLHTIIILNSYFGWNKFPLYTICNPDKDENYDHLMFLPTVKLCIAGLLSFRCFDQRGWEILVYCYKTYDGKWLLLTKIYLH